jgi:hypothetical protein
MENPIDNKAKELEVTLNNKIESYKNRAESLISTSKKQENTKKPGFNLFNIKIKLNMVMVYVIFIIFFIMTFYILKFFKPKFICNKVVNETTHFHEYKICIFKHLLYNVMITICIACILYLGYYIYLTQFKN